MIRPERRIDDFSEQEIQVWREKFKQNRVDATRELVMSFHCLNNTYAKVFDTDKKQLSALRTKAGVNYYQVGI